ncbi:MAG: hypothetical protein IRY91_13030 [Gemmatimonadaceae bacterium]|nr:hypothetical protein [Gemmatimonadaceae bacterium]
MLRMAIRGSLLAAVALATPVAAQTTDSTRLRIDVQPTIVAIQGDTVRVSYVVRNRPESVDTLFGFTVDAPGILAVERPGPRTLWMVSTRWRLRHVASWNTLDQHPLPGQATPPLVYRAIGLPDIVQYWADRYTDDIPPDTLGDLEPSPADDSVAIDGVTGFTVGVGPLPADRGPEGLAKRLAGLVERACRLGWIDERGVCNSLQVKVRPRRESLSALRRELDAQRGKHVSETAYVLLVANVDALLQRVP